MSPPTCSACGIEWPTVLLGDGGKFQICSTCYRAELQDRAPTIPAKKEKRR